MFYYFENQEGFLFTHSSLAPWLPVGGAGGGGGSTSKEKLAEHDSQYLNTQSRFHKHVGWKPARKISLT